MRDTVAMPEVAGPEESEPYDMRVIGRAVRVVDGAYSPDPDRIGPPELYAWLRFRDDPPGALPAQRPAGPSHHPLDHRRGHAPPPGHR